MNPAPETIGLKPGDNLAQAGRKILGFYSNVMQAHEAGTRLGEDIEELHDMRVATRRMRAALDIFSVVYKPRTVERLAGSLKLSGRALGAVRDWDVFLQKAGRDIAALPEQDQAALAPLLAAWQRQRETARRKLLKHLDGGKYRRLKERLAAFSAHSGASARQVRRSWADSAKVPAPRPTSLALLAPEMCYARLANVRAYEEILTSATIEQIHALRIEFKRLHYLLDFLKEILPASAKVVLQTVKKMQDHLGDLHDADVAVQMLASLSQESYPQPTRAAITAYLALKTAERQRLLDEFPAAWNKFNAAEIRQNFALMLAEL